MKTPRSMNTRAHIRISQKIPDTQKFRPPKNSGHPIQTLKKFRTPKKISDTKKNIPYTQSRHKKFRTPKKFRTSFANTPGDRQTEIRVLVFMFTSLGLLTKVRLNSWYCTTTVIILRTMLSFDPSIPHDHSQVARKQSKKKIPVNGEREILVKVR